MTAPAAPAWSTARWFNTAQPLALEALRGRIVMLHAFKVIDTTRQVLLRFAGELVAVPFRHAAEPVNTRS